MPRLETVGTFDGVITGQKMKQSKKGTWSINVMLEVTGGEHAGEHAWFDFWLSQKAMTGTLEKLGKTFGYTGGLSGLREANFVGAPVRFEMAEEEYDGKKSIRCQGVYDPESGPGYQAPSDDLWQEFCEQQGIETPKPAVQPQTNPQSDSDDSLPF